MNGRPILKSESRKAARTRKVVADAMSRRERGDGEPDAVIIQRHADLMPELGNELALLAMFERAADSARGDSTGIGWRGPASGRINDWESGFEGYGDIHEIYRGGQGVVFAAVQTSTGRRVAIKVMREGLFGNERDAARFEREVRILARLDHPGIVGIIDSGMRQGHVYYVMDFVEGEPLDVAAARFPFRRRLRLFEEVCAAVHAAHVRGIIHRDLKPANILVDSGGRPRVLDFGLARITGDEVPSRDVTLAGQFVGSMPWASPEQTTGGTSAVDLRADVYSLGVMLYQITTGTFPYSVDGPPREVLERIQNAEPRRPRAINRQVPEDVEAITLKCLRKRADERYAIAGEIAQDLRRFLDGRAVVAQPPDVGYQLRSFARRNRGLIAAALAIVLVFAGGASGTMWALFRALKAEHIAGLSLDQVRREAKGTDTINEFLIQLLSLAHPSVSKGRDVSLLKDMLDQASPRIETQFPDRDDIRAKLHNCVSETYHGLGIYTEAESHARLALDSARRAFGELHAETAHSYGNLGAALAEQARHDEAEGPLRQSYEIMVRVNAPADQILVSKLNLAIRLRDGDHAQEGERMLRECVDEARRILPQGPSDLAVILGQLAAHLYDTGRPEEALPLIDEAIEREAQRDPPLGTRLANLWQTKSSILGMGGDEVGSEAAARRCLDLLESSLRPDHPEVISANIRLISQMLYLGENDEATLRAERLVEASVRALGRRHPSTGYSLYLLGECRLRAGRLEDAERLFTESIAAYSLDDPHCPVEATDPLRSLASIYLRRKEFAKAEPMFRQAMELRVGQYGEVDRRSIAAIGDLGRMYMKAGDAAAAEELVRRALAAAEKLRAGVSETAALRRDLSYILVKQRRFADAEPYSRQDFPDDPARHAGPALSLTLALNHAGCLMEIGELDAAEHELRYVLRWPALFDERASERSAEVVDMLIQLLEATGRTNEAAALRTTTP